MDTNLAESSLAIHLDSLKSCLEVGEPGLYKIVEEHFGCHVYEVKNGRISDEWGNIRRNLGKCYQETGRRVVRQILRLIYGQQQETWPKTLRGKE